MTLTETIEAIHQTREIAAVAFITGGDERFLAIDKQLSYLIGRLCETERRTQHERARSHYEALAEAAR